MMMNGLRTLCLSLLFPALLAGCKPDAEPAPAPSAKPEAQPAKKPAATAAAERPSLRIATLDHGQFDLAAHRGKWVIVNYWATWCGPCLKEMPELSALAAMRDHIQVIGLAYEDTTIDAMRAFLAKNPVVYPIALVDVYNPPADFAAPIGLPVTWLIAPDGKLARKFTGPLTARMLEEEIARQGGPMAG
ncbi:MAG: TlpA disulfide reductase family protein [Thermomonas sp.]|uniref:TlpA family protein disulfide reductase n=1 Tax=Thermomonas sp. TaxID=1971895 RepID=UPI0039E59575